jgi:hypothetical protein
MWMIGIRSMTSDSDHISSYHIQALTRLTFESMARR